MGVPQQWVAATAVAVPALSWPPEGARSAPQQPRHPPVSGRPTQASQTPGGTIAAEINRSAWATRTVQRPDLAIRRPEPVRATVACMATLTPVARGGPAVGRPRASRPPDRASRAGSRRTRLPRPTACYGAAAVTVRDGRRSGRKYRRTSGGHPVVDHRRKVSPRGRRRVPWARGRPGRGSARCRRCGSGR